MLILIFVQFTNIYLTFSQYHPVGKPEIWLSKPQIIKTIEKSKNNNFRLYTIEENIYWNDIFLKRGWIKPEEYLPFNNGLIGHANFISDVSKTNFYTRFTTKRMSLLNQIIQDGIYSDEKNIFISSASAKLLGMLSTKYLLSSKKITGFRLINQDSGFNLYENNFYINSPYFVSEALYAKTFEKLQKIITADSFDPKKQIVFSNETDVNLDKKVNGQKPIIILSKYRQDSQEYRINTKNDGFLVFADSYYPGWKAYVDNKKVKILAANINQKSIWVEKGVHKIKITYESSSLKLGIIVSSITYLIIVGTLLIV